MKKSTVFLATALIAFASVAGPFADAITSGNIGTACRFVAVGNNECRQLITTPELARQLYDAAVATQAWANADIAANFCYYLGDKATLREWFTKAATIIPEKCASWVSLHNQISLNTNETSTSWAYYTNTKGEVMREGLSLAVTEPEMVFDFCKKALAAGNYDAAMYISSSMWRNSDNSNNIWDWKFSDNFTPEMQQFMKDNFCSPAGIERLKYASSMYRVLNFCRRIEIFQVKETHDWSCEMWKDAPLTTPLLTQTVLKKLALANAYANIPANDAGNVKYWNAVLELGNVKYKMLAAKRLDKKARNMEASKKIFQEVLDNASWGTAADFALYIGDVDLLLDTFIKIDTTATAQQIEAVIPVFNSINAGYRTADLSMALRNINKKYTIKLYDDRATWEPILSKVRAMLDTL